MNRASLVLAAALVALAAGCECGADTSARDAGARDAGPRPDGSVVRPPDSGMPPCGPDPTPPGAPACPGECTGGCTAENVCVIDCPSMACNDTTVTCPQNYDCRIDCHGLDACDTSTIQY